MSLLFNRSSTVRSEALYRLSYIAQSMPNASAYLPNMNHVIDIIPDNLCILNTTIDPNSNDFSDLYEKSYIEPMIEILNASNTEPSVRHSTLVQLNVMVADPKVAKHFFKLDGIRTILDILDDSLRENSIRNYTHNAIPIVGILAKLCTRSVGVRRHLVNDMKTLLLLFRSHLLFYQNDTFKQDSAVVLFSLAFADYIVGVERGHLTLPSICRKLSVPIKCEFHLNENISEVQNFIRTELLGDCSVESGMEFKSKQLHSHRCENSIIWRYIRLCFASQWFGSMKAMEEQMLSATLTDQRGSLDYGHKMSEFNSDLCIQQEDVEIIKNTSPHIAINYWLQSLRNATTHGQAALSCAAIRIYSNLDPSNNEQWNYNLVLNGIKRFALSLPHGEKDEITFRTIQHLIIDLVEKGNETLHNSLNG